MGLNDLPIFRMITGRMAWLTRRQQILAQNIANSDTPEYRPRDLVAQKFRALLDRSRPAVRVRMTSARHIAPRVREVSFRDAVQKKTYETSPAGNAVILEEQLMKVSETAGQYRLATNLYAKHVAMIKAALGSNR